MIRLASRQMSPINGWQFFEASTGMRFHEWSGDVLVTKIYQHRMANPRFGLNTDRNAIWEEVDYQNALRMQAIPNASTYIMSDDTPIPNPQVPPSLGHSLLSAVVGNRVAAGALTLSDWWLDGATPVDFKTANDRASICASCPKNELVDHSSFFTVGASQLIARAVEHRNSLKLKTDYDTRLGVCLACECPLKLKVHVPKQTILKHMDAPALSKLDPICWITK